MPTEVTIFLIAAIGTIGFIFYTFFTTRHKERMAIIEKGADINYPGKESNGYGSLKWGLVLICLGLGLSIGIALDISRGHDGPFFTFPLLVIGAGLGQLLYYRMRKNDEM